MDKTAQTIELLTNLAATMLWPITEDTRITAMGIQSKTDIWAGQLTISSDGDIELACEDMARIGSMRVFASAKPDFRTLQYAVKVELHWSASAGPQNAAMAQLHGEGLAAFGQRCGVVEKLLEGFASFTKDERCERAKLARSWLAANGDDFAAQVVDKVLADIAAKR